MLELTPRYAAGFVVGLILCVGFLFLAPRIPAIHGILVYVVSIGTLISLPFWFIQLKRDAVPAKRTDLIGYAVILAFAAGIGVVAYRVLGK